MNKDQVSGKVEQAVGKVKQRVGETVGNEKLANQGVADQAKGAARETWGQRQRRCQRGGSVAQGRRNRQGTRAEEQDQSVSPKCEGESQREDRRIQGASFILMRRGFDHLFLSPLSFR